MTATATATATATVTEAAVSAAVTASAANLSGLSRPALAEVHAAYLATGGGSALTAGVLDRARDPGSALHGYFEWNDTAAAEAYRWEQAEGLVRRVRVTLLLPDASESVTVRAFIATAGLHRAAAASGDTEIADAPPGSYRLLTDVTGTPAYEAATLATIAGDLRRLQYKYRAHRQLFTAAVQSLVEDTNGSAE